MNISWKIVKVIGAFVVIVGIMAWAFTATRSQSYSGANLDFGVGSGLVTITNPSEQSVLAQFTRAGTRSFTLSSNIDGVSGNSTRLGSGSDALHRFEFELPSGISEFTITRGSDDVMFVASTPIELEATVTPMTADTSRNVFIAAFVVILGLLFYASNAVQHSWIGMIMGKSANVPDVEPAPVVSSAQGRVGKAFGDNRSNTGD